MLVRSRELTLGLTNYNRTAYSNSMPCQFWGAGQKAAGHRELLHEV